MNLRSLSLRTQLLLAGLAATAVPIFALLGVVFATSSSEEILEGPNGEQTIGRSESTSDAVPPAVVIAAFALAAAAALAVWWWSKRAVRPMQDITDLANRIQAGSLDQRLGITGEAQEVQELGDSFDQMLNRLETASQTQQRLIEDTSHELRTPLAALAVNNEVIRNNPEPTADDYDESFARSEALIERLQSTIDELLQGARQRNQQTRQVDNDLMTIVHRVADLHRSINPDVPIAITGPDELRLGMGSPSIERLLTNLVENAARFSPTDQPIEIDVAAEPPTLSVTDHGPGIAPEDLPHVFDRYFRADQTNGNGIGLALVKQIADAHGEIAVESPLAGQQHGTRFVVSFTPAE